MHADGARSGGLQAGHHISNRHTPYLKPLANCNCCPCHHPLPSGIYLFCKGPTPVTPPGQVLVFSCIGQMA